MNKRIVIIFLLFAFSLNLPAQINLTQTVRGKVIDAEAQSPVPGVTLLIENTNPQIVTSSNARGEFRLENVPVGRITLKVLMLSYNPVELRNLELKSGKELILTIEMTEKVTDIDEVIIKPVEKTSRKMKWQP